MGLFNIFKSLVSSTKKLDVNKLPSQGLFYREDFSIKIKKADIEDIIDYEHKFDKTNLIKSIDCIKKVVNKNVILSEGYSYMDIKSVDIIFIFLEIVKHTNNKDIVVPYVNKIGKEDFVSFGTDNFNYFKFDDYMENYDPVKDEFLIDDYRFSLPSIGVETALTDYLATKTDDEEIKRLNKASYNFMFFLGYKNWLSFSEIDNLLYIFNEDLDTEELDKIKRIVEIFKGIVGYSLIVDGEEVEVRSKINLQDIWKS
jgi:hypothetical protein